MLAARIKAGRMRVAEIMKERVDSLYWSVRFLLYISSSESKKIIVLRINVLLFKNHSAFLELFLKDVQRL